MIDKPPVLETTMVGVATGSPNLSRQRSRAPRRQKKTRKAKKAKKSRRRAAT